jgi:SAM-dependent methyltransferase
MTNFDPVGYKRSTRDQWQAAAAWRRWQPVIDGWLREGTDLMLDLAQVQAGGRVLDVAAGAGGQSFAAARRVGPKGEVLATDVAENLVRYLERDAAAAGLTQVRAAVMDGEDLRVPRGRFDAVICRLGLMYLPDREAALSGMGAALRPGGRLGAIVFSTPEANRFFSVPASIIRRAAQIPLRCRASPVRSASARRTFCGTRSTQRASSTSTSARFRPRCGWRPRRNACASNVSHSGRCTRCWPG